MANKKGSHEKAADRRKTALQMRIAGGSFRAIADQLGISSSQAFRDVQEELDKVAKQTLETATQLRDLELERLDVMLLAIWQQARGNAQEGIPPKLAAVDRVLRIMERRAKLLGLDAPAKSELTGANGGPIKVTDGLTDDERSARIAALFDAARARRTG